MKTILVLALVLAATSPVPHAHGQDIQWRIVNPYPFFMDAGDWNRLKPAADDTFESWTSKLQAQAEARTRIGEPLWPASNRTQWNEGDAKARPAIAKGFRPGYLDARLELSVGLSGIAPNGDCKWHMPTETKPCSQSVSLAVLPETDTPIAVTLPDGQVIERTIRIDREFILALGDSFSSGEGNPDLPIRFCKKQQNGSCAPYNLNGKGANWFPAAMRSGIQRADWLDDQCNRSLYSYQNLIAMWRASRDPHKAVYFVPLACSGAEIKDGLLKPQSDPPGGLLPKTPAQISLAKETFGCTSESCIHAPDIILLSIGGNDAYFAPLLTGTLTPQVGRSVFGSMGMSLIRGAKGMDDVAGNANFRLTNSREIPQEIRQMLESLKKGLAKKRPKLVVTGYPNLLRREDGQWCSLGCTRETPYSGSDWKNPDWIGNPDLSCRSSINHALNHVSFLPLGISTKDWTFRITGDPSDNAYSKDFEQEVLNRDVIELLKPSLLNAYLNSPQLDAFDFLWVDPPAEISRHGVCSVENTPSPRSELEWPWSKSDGQWIGGLSPFEWNAYARRARWFRTPNDVYQTQVSKEIPPQGAFHPTAEYHAALAREVVRAMGDQTSELDK